METDVDIAAEAVLDACRQSSTAAYRQFEEILARLEAVETRAAARQLLAALQERLPAPHEAALAAFHFTLRPLAIGRPGRSHDTLTLLHLPSVFEPEEWSRTFFEGLARFPAGEFTGRTLAELGCGNGWISIALGRQQSPAKVYGLDINPRAVACARLNLYLNALTPEGELIRDEEGRSLLDRVEFHESDLLAWVRSRKLALDRVIGCVPQVLNPDLRAMERISGAESDEFLVSLSNYTARQGYLEDQFGLGLVARALEEAIEVLRPEGRVILNLGGRPGRRLLTQLFRRRGFRVREVWTTKIRQAADTDIDSLVEIERSSPHRFEFFLGVHSDEPVGARTALAYSRAGGPVYHALTVFEAQLRSPEPLQHLYRTLDSEVWRPSRSALDLGFEDDGVAEEKAVFLARLIDLLAERRPFPYEDVAGSLWFRRHLAEFLRRYLGIPLGEESLILLPDRASALRHLFLLYAPALALVHPSLAAEGPGEILECPARADLACKLMETLRPQLVATTLEESDVRTPDAFLRLVETAGRTGARLVVDISPFFELQSAPRSNGVVQALADAPLPAHVTILCSLVKNQVYQDLELGFLLAENRSLLEAMAGAAEVSYSRVPLLTQHYYDAILAELLSFRLDLQGSAEPVAIRRPLPQEEELAPACRKAFAHPAITGERLARTPRAEGPAVRLDYGENELASPDLVRVKLFEAFARRGLTAAEADPSPEVASFLRRRFGFVAPRLAFGLGVAPLFAALARGSAAEEGTFLFPAGSYGEFVAAVDFFGGRRQWIETERKDDFKVTPDALDRVLRAGAGRPWLYLNAPVVNPTGALYGADEIVSLLAVAARHRARVVLDVLFSGLETEETIPWDLEPLVASHSLELVVLGGISKELAAGGLRFGFAGCRSEEMYRLLSNGSTAAPHRTIAYAARGILAGLNRPTPATRDQLLDQRQILRSRAMELAQVLRECGWEPLLPRGGLFLVARPAAYLGRSWQGGRLDSENLGEAMFRAVGLLINDSRWTGIPEHCRFVLSVDERSFREGLERIRRFRELVLG